MSNPFVEFIQQRQQSLGLDQEPQQDSQEQSFGQEQQGDEQQEQKNPFVDFIQQRQEQETPGQAVLKPVNEALGVIIRGGSAPFRMGWDAAKWVGKKAAKAGAEQQYMQILNNIDKIAEKHPEVAQQFKDISRAQFADEVEDKLNKSVLGSEQILGRIEEATGAPLTPKSAAGEMLSFVAEAATFSSGSALQKIYTALKSGAWKSFMEAGGADENVSSLVGFFLGHQNMPIQIPEAMEEVVSKGVDKAKQFLKIGEPPAGAPPGGGEPPSGGRTPSPGASAEAPGRPPPGGGEPPAAGEAFSIDASTRARPLEEVTGPADIPEKPIFKDLIPQDEMLESLQPVLLENLEKKVGKPPKIFEIGEPVPPNPPKLRPESERVREIGEIFSRTRAPSPRSFGSSLMTAVEEASQKEYKAASKLYDYARSQLSNVEGAAPELSEALQGIIEDLKGAELTRVRKDLLDTSKKLLKRTGTAEKGYKAWQANDLITQIQEVNRKIGFKYMQGESANQFLPLKRALEQAVEGIAYETPGLEAFQNANSAYRKWAETFKHRSIIPYRSQQTKDIAKLAKSSVDVDRILQLEPILNRSKQGRALLDMLKREYVTDRFKAFIKDPSKVGSAEYDEAMRAASDIFSGEKKIRLDSAFEEAKAPLEEYTAKKLEYEQSKARHKELVEQQDAEIKAFHDRARQIEKDFPFKTEEQLLKGISTTRGLKKLEKWLPNTDQGRAMFEQAKRYGASRLLSQGKFLPSSKAETLRKIVNDVDKFNYLKFTIGNENASAFKDLINNFSKYERALQRAQASRSLNVTLSKFVPGMSRVISKGDKAYRTMNAIANGLKKADYGMIELSDIESAIGIQKALKHTAKPLK